MSGTHTRGELPQITISVVSHGQSNLVATLLADLKAASAEISMRVVVTLNLPERELAIESVPGFEIQWIENPKPRGFGENHNAAFRFCETSCFCVLNPDVRLSAESLKVLLASVNRKCGVVGPRVVRPDGAMEDSARKVPSPLQLLKRYLFGRRQADYCVSLNEQQVDWLAGMCMLFDRDTYAQLGGFDKKFRLYCEDVDICLRIHLLKGHVTWVQDSVVVHDARRASHGNWRYLVWHIESLLRLYVSSSYWKFRLFGRGREAL